MTNREKAEAAWGVPLPDWIEKLATACDGKGTQENGGGSRCIPGHREPRHPPQPREARLHRAAGEGHPRHFHHPLPRAWTYQPERIAGTTSKSRFHPSTP